MDEPYIFTLDAYIIDQKLLSLRDTYIIRDSRGEEIGRAVKKFLSLGPKITVYDEKGDPVARLEGRAFSLRGNIRFIDWRGRTWGVLKKKILKFIGSEYWFEDDNGNKIYRVKGKFTHHEYKILHEETGEPLAEISKKWLTIRDAYGIRILDKEKLHPFIAIGTTLAIDLIEHPGR
jgi:uncharacterized protein YxjI